MKKYLLTAALLACVSASAQDLTSIQTTSSEDLNGTARFVGMGGAMSALGADMSTMSTNPAGMGLFRKSDVSFTFSGQWQPSSERRAMNDRDKFVTSFDQAGFVFALPMGNSGKLRGINLGFNYHKSRNFQEFVCTNDIATGGLSQSMQLEDLTKTNIGGFGVIDLENDAEGSSWGRSWALPISNLAYDCYYLDAYDNVDLQGTYMDPNTGRERYYSVSPASSYNYNRVQWGDTRAYDFNISFNIKDRAYLGFDVGYYTASINSVTQYNEVTRGMSPTPGAGVNVTGPYAMVNDQYTSGSGVDFKFGLIVRPIEDNPFRFGLAIHTPRFMSMTSNSVLSMRNGNVVDGSGNIGQTVSGAVTIDPFRYRIRTPWKLNFSLATTLSNWLALDAEYEMNNYSSAAIQYEKDSYYRPGYGYLTDAEKDVYWDNEVKANLKTQHTFRLGVEGRFATNFYGRFGYNYVTSCYKDNARLVLSPYAGDDQGFSYNDGKYSESYYQQTSTDLVRFGDINRVTFGLGYHGKNFYVDAAYMLQTQKAAVRPFDLGADIHVPEANVTLHRNQILLTLGAKF